MNVNDHVKKLKELKIYSGLLKLGIIPVKVNTHFEMYKHYESRLDENKGCSDSITRSKTDTSMAFNCSEMTIHRAITYMKREID